jgi:prepilin-type processing-associated H-X9-DG protein
MELLVVIAVLGILAGILFPVLAQVREVGRRTRCLSHLRQMAHAHALYLQDWEERFPEWRFRLPDRPAGPGGFANWMDYLQPYVKSRALFTDSSDNAPPLFPAEGTKLADYALMTWGPSGSGMIEDPYFRWAGPALVLTQVVRPSETILLMDGYTTTTTSRGFEARHQGGVNAVFLDGHGGWLPFKELYRLDSDGSIHYFHYATVDR